MSGLLKASDPAALRAVRPLDAISPAAGRAESHIAPSHVFPEPPARDEALDRQCMELEAAIADLRHRIAHMEDEAGEREDAAFERGRQDGLDHAAGEETRRLELLGNALDKLQKDNGKFLADCELLALQLARTALARIFGDEQLNAGLVTATLAHHIVSLQRDMLLQLRVSPRDFRRDDDLAALASRFPGLAVIADETLGSGECVADLKLGTLDVGLAGQWRRLSEFFDLLAAERGAT